MVKAAGVPMTIHLTLDREEALKDADFVTTQFRVGLLDARIKDERIPLSHGIIGQETNGEIKKVFETSEEYTVQSYQEFKEAYDQAIVILKDDQ